MGKVSPCRRVVRYQKDIDALVEDVYYSLEVKWLL